RSERGAVDHPLADDHEEGEEHQHRQCRPALRQWSAGGHATTVLRRDHALGALTVVEHRDGLPGAVQQADVAAQRVGAHHLSAVGGELDRLHHRRAAVPATGVADVCGDHSPAGLLATGGHARTPHQVPHPTEKDQQDDQAHEGGTSTNMVWTLSISTGLLSVDGAIVTWACGTPRGRPSCGVRTAASASWPAWSSCWMLLSSGRRRRGRSPSRRSPSPRRYGGDDDHTGVAQRPPLEREGADPVGTAAPRVPGIPRASAVPVRLRYLPGAEV